MPALGAQLKRRGPAPRDPAEGYAAGLARAQVAALDEQLVQLRHRISQAALACTRTGLDALDTHKVVRAALDQVDTVRAALREVDITP